MKYENRADLLIAAGESIKMQGAAGVRVPVCKYGKCIEPFENKLFNNLSDYEFPISVVEGKPVFDGDVLYWRSGAKTIVSELWGKSVDWHELSWNPPKPKTVMVELLVEDAHAIAGSENWPAIRHACRKALEEMK